MPNRKQSGTVLEPLTRAAIFGANDAVDWNDLGPTSTSLPNPCILTTLSGLWVTVSQPGTRARFVRRDQAVVPAPTRAWIGNLAPGRALLTTGWAAGRIKFVFEAPILGGGAQIQPNRHGLFTATVAAFNATGFCLARFTLEGDLDRRGRRLRSLRRHP